jgi:hypothetical protein
MTLKYGVWRNGELVGKMGGKEVVAVSRSADLPLQAKGEPAKEGEPPELQAALREAATDPMDSAKGTSHEIDTLGNLQIPVLQTRLQMTHPTITGNCTLTFLLLIRHNT